jgi:hypothetical protein
LFHCGFLHNETDSVTRLNLRAVLRNRDVYPGSWFLPIPDPGSKISNKREGWKKICYAFYCSHKFHTISLFYFLNAEEKIWASFQRIRELFTQKFVKSSQKHGFGIRDPDPGSWIRAQGSKRYQIPDPQHCLKDAQNAWIWNINKRR